LGSTKPAVQSNPAVSGPKKSSSSEIFVKSAWVPRNDEELGYLEDEIERIDSVIIDHGKTSKQAKQLEVSRHGLTRRIAKYKAEQIRAARKVLSPPPPLPSELAPNPAAAVLSYEERKKLDVAAGWRRGQANDASTTAPVDNIIESSAHTSANDIFKSRHNHFVSSKAPGRLTCTVDSNSELDGKRGYSNSLLSTEAFETAKRIEALSSQLAAVRAAKTAIVSSNSKVAQNSGVLGDSDVGCSSKRSTSKRSAVGAAAAPFANDLTWDMLDKELLSDER
jgi:hypothetical protein